MTDDAFTDVPDDTSQARRQPGGAAVVTRGILAIIAGPVVMALGVALYQGLFVMLPLYLRDPQGFQRLAELSASPEAFRAAYEAGTIPKLGTLALALTVAADGLCALAGGFATAAVAARAKFRHGIAVALLMATWSLIYGTTSEIESVLPAWVPWTRALVSVPLGVIAGAWLRVRR